MIKKIRRLEKKVPSGAQRGFSFAPESSTTTQPAGMRGAPVFKQAAREQLFVGDVKLGAYLKQAGLGWVIRMLRVLEEVDISAMLARYDGTGRQPYDPRMLLGLVIFGVLEGKWSLRELEALAARDVGAWWICGGLRPDHSTIGRFLVLHQDTLTDEFFTNLTQMLVSKLRLQPGEATIDGTVIAAAASHVSALRREALQQALTKATIVADAAPSDDEAKARVTQLAHAAEVLKERDAQRAVKGRGKKGAQIVPHEPEAVMQTQKNKTVRPSYKPTLMTHHESGLIVGQAVHPSSETAAVPTLMAQHEVVFSAPPSCTMLDAGFFSAFVLRFFLERDLDVLCPSGQAFNAKSMQRRPRASQHFLKTEFTFDVDRNVFRCPANKLLVLDYTSTDKSGSKYSQYRGVECADCPLKSKCTKGVARTVKRYASDDVKEAQLEVMQQPSARKRFRRRSLGEHVFSGIKGPQRLTRFHRRGLKGARLEVALHVAAWNIRVGVSSFPLFFIVLCVRGGPQLRWRAVSIVVAFPPSTDAAN